MAKEVTESAYDSVEPYFTARKQDSIEQKGRRPKDRATIARAKLR